MLNDFKKNLENFSWIRDAASRDQNFRSLSGFWMAAYAKNEVSKHVNVVGTVESQAGFIISALNIEDEIISLGKVEKKIWNLVSDKTQGFPFLIASDELQARRLIGILDAFYPGEILYFPAREFNLSQVESTSKSAMHERIAILSKLLHPEKNTHKPLIILTAAALEQRLPDFSEFKSKFIELHLGDEIEPLELVKQLTDLGYRQNQLADSPGEISHRGDIVDIVPVDLKQAENPESESSKDFYGIRISFFDTEIDQIKYYDPETQRQVDASQKIVIPPAQEINLNQQEKNELREKIKQYVAEKSKEMFKQAASKEDVERFRSFCEVDLEKIINESGVEVFDRWLELIYSEKTTVLDVFSELEGRAIVFDVKKLQESLLSWEALKERQITQLLSQGKTIALVIENIIGKADIMHSLDSKFNVLSFSLLDQSGNGFPNAEKINFRSLDAENYRSREDELFAYLVERRDNGAKSYIYVADESKRDKLNSKLLLKAPGAIERLVPIALNQGFLWPDAALLILGNENIFGQRYKRRKSKKKHAGATIEFFSDLTVGDYVVHEDHGIGIYEGLEKISTVGGTKDYMKISYAKGDSLYLPMEAIEQLSKYIGMDSRKPRISRLGGGDWEKLKNKARESIKQLATNLVELYAKRDKIKGHKFSVDTVWDKEFADGFPFEETDDQLQAMEEISKDMESDKVMDRLLIGDVGFGKTELAFRAMFKAVNNNLQAAMLAPTTVLTQQHYENFIDRAKNFPINVGLLSRFATASEQEKTIKGLANGEIDVVIGTHRLLSKDVKFKRLGLLVVDEEQRFGVDHKESLKEKYPTVDVLFLSATPIPRTLHMSLSGIRDISNLEEAPQERREVQTFVLEYDEALLDEAITREIARGGQVFYLNNNVKKIAEIVSHLETRIPGLRVLAGHGQMPEGELENIIRSFINREADVLVCTTIIESGIDMPNVNTLIVTNADRLGLAQIYQIKGRVGRSNKQAYAYITYEGNKILTEDAQKRLATIRDYTSLGSGMKIAMKDLEVRGAGNLLGGEQHGHMESIGYELYVQMLEEEVNRIRSERLANAENNESDLYFDTELDDFASADVKTRVAMDKNNRLNAKLIGRTRHNTGQIDETKIDSTFLESESEKKTKISTQIDLKLDAYLPSSLIQSDGQKMDMYKRLLEIDNIDDYYDILDELNDRYGDVPAETYTLANVSYVESRASLLGLERIFVERKNVIMEFSAKLKPNMESLSILMNLSDYKRKLRFDASNNGRIVFSGAGADLEKVPELLMKLFSDVEKELKTDSKVR